MMLYFCFSGRLGNQLFQYANAASLCDVSDIRGYLTTEQAAIAHRLSKEMFGDLKLVDHLPAGVETYKEPSYNYVEIPPSILKKDVIISGIYQSERYFNEEKVRKIYAVSEERRKAIFEKYGEWLNEPEVTGISIRRGDYLKYPERFPFVGENFFRECIKQLPECNHFIVCSDDIPWCKNFFLKEFSGKKFLFVESEEIMNQLYLQSFCKNNIMSNSTFSWWGAWLNENKSKKVFAPSMWFGLLLRAQGYNWSDVYFKNTIIIKTRYTFKGYISAVMHIVMWFLKKHLAPMKQCVFKRLFGTTHLFGVPQYLDVDKEK